MEMFVPVGDIMRSNGLSKRYEYTGPFDMAEVDVEGDVEINVKLTNAGSRILVDGYIKAKIIQECARCLKDYTQELDIPVQEEFLPEGSKELETEDLNWDNLSQFSYSGDQIDLYELVRQNILAAAPIKPLCDEICEGVEGTSVISDEQAGKSDDENKSIDPRLLPLMNIKRKAEGNDNE